MRDEIRQTESNDRALSAVVGRLTDRDPRVRELAADEAGDYLRDRACSHAGAQAAVERLVAAAVAADEERVQEAALNACGGAQACYDLPLALFEPLVPLMSRLSTVLIGYVLGILGATHDPAARSIIASFAEHADLSVRAEAADALVELAGRSS